MTNNEESNTSSTPTSEPASTPETASSQEAQPAPAAAQPSPVNQSSGDASSTGLDPSIASGLCAIFPLIGGIIFMILEKQSALVKFWSMQSLFFGVFAIALSIALTITSTILAFIPIIGWLIGLLLWLVAWLGLMALWIFGIVQAFQGKRWKMPILGALVEKQLGARKAA